MCNKILFIIVIITIQQVVKCINDYELCWYGEKGYDLRYELPSNRSVRGRKFSCNLIKYLDEFNFLNKSTFIDLSERKVLKIQVVTGISENHYMESEKLLLTFRNRFRNQKIIVYDLGLMSRSVEHLKRFRFVEYRIFNFSHYPKHVSNLKTYAFKDLIIAEVMKEYSYVLWVDSSVRFLRNNLMHRINKLINCYHGKDQDTREKEQLKLLDGRKKDKYQNVLSTKCYNCFRNYKLHGFDKNLFKFNIQHCHKSHVLMHIPTFHGILIGYHPKMENYIPTDKSKYTINNSRQHGGGMLLFVRTKYTIEDIMKWAVLCSLTEDCIAPVPWSSCDNVFTKKNIFSSEYLCHRFDQTMLAILLQNSNNYDYHNYVTEIYDYAEFSPVLLKKRWKLYN